MKLLGDTVVLDYEHDPLTGAGNQTTEFPYGKRLVHGHFRARRYVAAHAYWMTFLRHPVDNLISIYFFWMASSEPSHALHARFIRERPTILDFAAYSGFQSLMSETYFGGFDMSRFDFIGFHESRDADIPRLAANLGLPLTTEVYENRTNAGPGRRELETDPNVRRRLHTVLAADIRFYDRARNEIARRI